MTVPHVPTIGYGTGTKWFSKAENSNEHSELNEELIDSIVTAIRCGYRHIDTAEIYGTEREVGIAIKKSGIDRKELFLTTKVNRSIQDPITAMDRSLKRLQVDYVDLYLIHDPFCVQDLPATWTKMESLVNEGKTRAIGVSNFRIQDFELIKDSKVKPIVNQIEFHAYLQQPELVQYMKEHGVQVEAYGSLVPLRYHPGPVDPIIQELAQKYNKEPEQIMIRWIRQLGHIAVTTSSKETRMKSMLDTEFEIDGDDVDRISKAGEGIHYRRFWAAKF
jgi:diketogulonate reductase-like aldo/keto reductase